jgi:hypothetical protein
MKTENERRLHPLDQASVPDAWPEIEQRAAAVAGSGGEVQFRGDETTPRRRVTAAMVGLAFGGASLLLVFMVFRGLDDGAPASPPGIFFPTLKEPANGYPAALAGGTLTDRNGCIVLQYEGGESLPIWPYGTTLQRDDTGALRVLRSDGSLIAEVGEYVKIGGGDVGGDVGEDGRDVSFAEQLIGQSIPTRCRVDGAYFMTSGETLPIPPYLGP